MGVEVLHFSQGPWESWCCWPTDHTLSSKDLEGILDTKRHGLQGKENNENIGERFLDYT